MEIKEIQTKQVEVTVDKLCNKCGKSLYVEDHKLRVKLGLSALADGCYKENHNDCQTYEWEAKYHHNDFIAIDLCYDCVIELLKTFKIKPEIE